MKRDLHGLAATCDGAEDLAAIDDFARRMVGLAKGTEVIVPAAARFQDTPLVQLYAAAAFLFAQTAEADGIAARYLARADAIAPRANPREERWRAALWAWQRHAFSEAVVELEALTAEWPGDLAAAKVCEFLYYVLGQQHEATRFLRHMERLAPHHADDPDFLAMLAFARELTGDFDGACTIAERALALRPQNPWADHALAHVWTRRGEVDRAIAHLTAALPVWRTMSSIIRSHDAWHLALLHVERLDLDAAAELLDAQIACEDCREVGFAVDAIALLWRMEMAGWDGAARWDAIADRIEPYLGACFMPFLSAHWAYALGRAGRDGALDGLVASVAARASGADGDALRAWARAGKALVEASGAFGRGDVRECAVLLAPIADELTVGGGSDAQCDLFRLTNVCALAASGRRAEARRALDRTLGAKARTPLDRRFEALTA
ncbi:MAG TPA: tetratricopeptide repeat protein [Candidatus Binatia bacterium]|nr:tetratricopeptide repeat protein [Candidatus Binatia bacterium]